MFDAYDVLGTEPLAGGLEAASRHWPDVAGGIPAFDLDVRVRSGDRLWINVSTIVFDNQRTGRRLFIRIAPPSVQERRILTLFSKGGNPAAIARQLKISPQTLRNHLHHINRKLRTHNRLEAVTHAQRRGLID